MLRSYPLRNCRIAQRRLKKTTFEIPSFWPSLASFYHVPASSGSCFAKAPDLLNEKRMRQDGPHERSSRTQVAGEEKTSHNSGGFGEGLNA
mmetsp:Transcript_9953/g.16415  ORF Transcript_9953/g.16415 Transcript_9953/m.16415 type:complete len:91 (+) Transcript_9953:164-436(+)